MCCLLQDEQIIVESIQNPVATGISYVEAFNLRKSRNWAMKVVQLLATLNKGLRFDNFKSVISIYSFYI